MAHALLLPLSKTIACEACQRSAAQLALGTGSCHFIGACAECMTGQVAGQRLASAGSGRVSCVAASLAARPWFVNGPESAPLLRREPTHGDLVWARIWSAF